MAVELEFRAQDVLAQEAVLLRLLDRDAETLHRDRILRADVEIAVVGADGVAGDDHALDDCQRIAFQDGAVHECARIALVTVADDVLLVARNILRELPLAAAGESAAAAAPETGRQDFVDDLLGTHGQRALHALERAHAHGFFHVLGVDDAAAGQCHTALLLVEIDVILALHLLRGARLHIKQTLHDAAAEDIGLHDLFHILDLHEAVKRILRIDLDKRPLGAEAEAAHKIHGGHIFRAVLLQDFLKLFHDLFGMAGKTSGTAAEDNVPLSVRSLQLRIQRFGTFGDLFIKLLNCSDHSFRPPLLCIRSRCSGHQPRRPLGKPYR